MNKLEKALSKIHITTDNGLVFCDRPYEKSYPDEIYHIHEKAKKIDASAVLFRRFYEEGEVTHSKPMVYIYYKNLETNSKEHKEIHKKIWSACEIDVYFIVSDTTINIFNARKPADIIDPIEKKLSLENLCLVHETLEKFEDQRFSALVFGKGVFWEQDDFFDNIKDPNFFRNKLSVINTPFQRLLEYLIEVRKQLHSSTNQLSIAPERIDKLLIICILIKFLEDKKDENGRHALEKIYKTEKVTDFAEAIEGGKFLSVLDELAREFNGNIFYLSQTEKKEIEEANLNLIADFLRANIDIRTKELFLWEQYSFNHLPVELISSIYENFLPKEKGVVYTPPFLVNFLIDEVMPLNKAQNYFSKDKFKILDPACGSGVFLVAAYKRLLQWWAVKYFQEKNEFRLPDKKVCQEILINNIFGVDIHPTARFITVFSLTIALLDRLEPKELWNNLKLNDLRKNIQEINFFNWALKSDNRDKKFDLVVGNPPFNPIAGISKKNAVTNKQLELYNISKNDIPNNNFALKFFEGALFFGSMICLIVPSSALLYNKTKSAQKYRTRIFTKFTILRIFDFTHLRRELFGSVDTPVCAVFAHSVESQGQKIEHIIINRIASNEKKIFFEIDHYDRHFVNYNWAIDKNKQFVWKTNLLGGSRLFFFIFRLSHLTTLKKFVSRKISENNEWIFSSGYKVGGKTKKQLAGFIEKGNKIESVNEDGSYSISSSIEKNKLLEYIPNEKLYKPPFIVFDQILGIRNIPISLIQKYDKKEYLYFNRDFVGIHAPKENISDLKTIYNFVRNKYNSLYRLYALIHSGSCMVLTETEINKRDIEALPFPDNEKLLKLSDSETMLQNDVLQYYIHLGKSVSEKGQGKILNVKVSSKQIKSFCKTFCEALNPIYAKNGKFWQFGKPISTKSFTICQFGYGTNNGFGEETVNDVDELLKLLIYNNRKNRNAMFTRVCRIYMHLMGYDGVFLIKPNATRYWLNSVALRDADDTYMDLMEAGL